MRNAGERAPYSAGVDAVYEETRRGVLGKSALMAGAFGLASLVRAEQASATHLDPADNVQGINSVTDPPPGGGPAADPTGSANSRAAIQAWIDASVPDGSHPGAVYFPPGTYLIDKIGTPTS
jgi:hypothetical protein